MYLFSSILNVILEFSYFELLVVEVYSFIVIVVEFLNFKGFYSSIISNVICSFYNINYNYILFLNLFIYNEFLYSSVLSMLYICSTSYLQKFICSNQYFVFYSFSYIIMFRVFITMKNVFSVFFNISNYLESLFILFVQFYLIQVIDTIQFSSLSVNFLIITMIDFLLAGILLLDMVI